MRKRSAGAVLAREEEQDPQSERSKPEVTAVRKEYQKRRIKKRKHVVVTEPVGDGSAAMIDSAWRDR